MAGLDTSPLGVLCAQVMEQISERFGEDATLRTAAVIVEVETEDASEILTASTEPRGWVQLAFLQEGIVALEDRLAEALDQEQGE